VIVTKTPEQIDKMAAAGGVLVKTLNLLQAKIRPGVTTAEDNCGQQPRTNRAGQEQTPTRPRREPPRSGQIGFEIGAKRKPPHQSAPFEMDGSRLATQSTGSVREVAEADAYHSSDNPGVRVLLYLRYQNYAWSQGV